VTVFPVTPRAGRLLGRLSSFAAAADFVAEVFAAR
jgi:hypothetical protein